MHEHENIIPPDTADTAPHDEPLTPPPAVTQVSNFALELAKGFDSAFSFAFSKIGEQWAKDTADALDRKIAPLLARIEELENEAAFPEQRVRVLVDEALDFYDPTDYDGFDRYVNNLIEEFDGGSPNERNLRQLIKEILINDVCVNMEVS
jgi:hypothetical protein